MFEKWLEKLGLGFGPPTDADGKNGPAEDPDVLLTEAQRQMREVHAKNRERAVQAITAKNSLEQMVRDTRRKLDALWERFEEAERRGDTADAEGLRAEAEHCSERLSETEQRYEEAVRVAETVKQNIRSEEERVRRKTAEAMALQAQWKAVQIEQAVARWHAEVSAGHLNRSREELQALHERNRVALAEAMQVRDELRRMVEQTARTIAEVKVKAEFARQKNDEPLERQLLREMEQFEATLLATRDALDRAEAVTDRATGLLRDEEARLLGLPMDDLPGGDSPAAPPLSPAPRVAPTDAAPSGAVGLMVAGLLLLVLLLLLLLGG